MMVTLSSILMFLAIVQLLLATVGVPGVRHWAWFPGGMLFWGIAMLMM